MRIGNKILNIKLGLVISLEPDIKKLTKELSDFFNENEIEGRHITKFRIENEFGIDIYKIIPEEPCFEEELSEGDYQESIEKIGNKYGIKNLGFVYWCYHK